MAAIHRELDMPLHNVAALLDLASWLVIGNMTRKKAEDGAETYRLPIAEGDQLAALLLAARDYATRALAAHDGEAS